MSLAKKWLQLASSKVTAFKSCNKGNMGMMLGVLIIPVLATMGVAFDFSRASHARMKLQRLSDEAALTASRFYGASLSQRQAIVNVVFARPQLNGRGKSEFLAQSSSSSSVSQSNSALTACRYDAEGDRKCSQDSRQRHSKQAGGKQEKPFVAGQRLEENDGVYTITAGRSIGTTFTRLLGRKKLNIQVVSKARAGRLTH